jgi:hypothetical protein
MHRLNIFLSCFGHSGWAGLFFFRLFLALTLTLNIVIIETNDDDVCEMYVV